MIMYFGCIEFNIPKMLFHRVLEAIDLNTRTGFAKMFGIPTEVYLFKSCQVGFTSFFNTEFNIETVNDRIINHYHDLYYFNKDFDRFKKLKAFL